jgi:hypothetical protein
VSHEGRQQRDRALCQLRWHAKGGRHHGRLYLDPLRVHEMRPVRTDHYRRHQRVRSRDLGLRSGPSLEQIALRFAGRSLSCKRPHGADIARVKQGAVYWHHAATKVSVPYSHASAQRNRPDGCWIRWIDGPQRIQRDTFKVDAYIF